MVLIKVFSENTDKKTKYYSAVNRTEAVSLLLINGFLDEDGQWSRRGDEHAEICNYDDSYDHERLWVFP